MFNDRVKYNAKNPRDRRSLTALVPNSPRLILKWNIVLGNR